MTRAIRFHGQSRLPAALAGLLNTGWTPVRAPDRSTLPRNGQAIVLAGGPQNKRIRLFAYTVTDSSRNRPHERRVEITSTYAGGLVPSPIYDDVIIAFDRQSGAWVGIDNRRLSHGGTTHNASTFLPAAGFGKIPTSGVLALPMESNLFTVEFASFFKVESLAEYIFNCDAIHLGTYDGKGRYSGNGVVRKPSRLRLDEGAIGGAELVLSGPRSITKSITAKQSAIEAILSGNNRKVRRLKLTREELLEIKRRCDEIGLEGERWGLAYERRRLIRAKRSDLANKISWVSQTYPYEGYDIASFEADGRQRFIEVKTTISNSKRFEISDSEWRRAGELKDRYYVYRITSISTAPALKILHDPVSMLSADQLTRTGSSWVVTYK